MIVRLHRKTKLFLVGLFCAKILLTAGFLMGHLPLLELIDSIPAAFAQDESEQKSEPENTPESEDQKEPEEEAPDKAAEMVRIELNGLEKKRLEIQAMEKRLEENRLQLENVKQEIEEKIESLTKIQKQLDGKLKKLEEMERQGERQGSESEEKKLKQLVKVYSSMNPKSAGPIIDQLDIEVAQKIFLRMKGEQAGKILTYVTKEKAAKISEKLAAANNKKKSAQ